MGYNIDDDDDNDDVDDDDDNDDDDDDDDDADDDICFSNRTPTHGQIQRTRWLMQPTVAFVIALNLLAGWMV